MAGEISPEVGAVDLFGAPVDQIRERWGRPGFAKTAENQRLVALLRGAGWNVPRIAGYLRCDEKTLRKHFSRELAAGADLTEGQVLEVLLQKARQGNIAAARRVLDVIGAGRAAVPLSDAARAAAEDAAEAVAIERGARRMGKKEETAQAARSPGSTWAELLN